MAQKGNWSLGFTVGLKGDVSQGVHTQDKYKFENRVTSFPLGLNVTYEVSNNLSVTSGIGYIEYYMIWRKVNLKAAQIKLNMPASAMMYKSAQIPLNLKYSIPLGKSNFRFLGKAGVCLDIVVDRFNNHSFDYPKLYFIDYEGKNSMFTYSCYPMVYAKKINLLVDVGAGFSCRLKNGLGFWIEGEYYIGTRIMGELLIKNRIIDLLNRDIPLKEYDEFLIIKGDYWNVGVGISYTFKQKNKE